MRKVVWVLALSFLLSTVGCVSPNRFGFVRTGDTANSRSEEWAYQKRFWTKIASDFRDAKADFDRIFFDLDYYPVEDY